MQELVIKVFMSMLGVLLILNFAATKTYKLNAFNIELDLKLSYHPSTTINFPPIGKIVADTHLTPLDLEVTLQSIHQEKLASIIENVQQKEELVVLLKERAKQILQLFIIRLLILSALAGMVGAGTVELTHATVMKGLVIGVVVVLSLGLGTYYTYNLSAFDDPNFVGMLEAAPWMISLIQEGIDNIEQLGAEVQLIASNMAQLFKRVDTLQPLNQVTGDLQVLHISDIHNNPVALKYVMQLVDSFNVDLVIDSGDITDYGTPIEGNLLTKIDQLKVPYIFVAGNHDSPAIIKQMKEFDNVIIIESNVINIKGLKIVGVDDPAADSKQMKPLTGEKMQESRQTVNKLVTKLKKSPDIVVVHEFRQAISVLGEIPLLLHGHDHSFKIYNKEGTMVVDAGTTGAAGIRGFEAKEEIPYSVALLHYNQSKVGNQLKAIDIIKFYSRRGGFMLERKLIKQQIKNKRKEEQDE
ncbi:putative phosphoesterase, ICC [Halobacteroides halobius DSM 5150]|uniref:Putative phosphoesterase, ICC n=1 Tax=Halobacteroides halobius (strain ATCC 35273 / DSM 5150 / MD-1) TaxID=748449 RepID=L0K948_HALHC|nr:metallophosphoesterase [Halobacteroides halobius]AGB41546.1 putative phosphoesterase, ICC [Halobacteroides halobius DSM 5150]